MDVMGFYLVKWFCLVKLEKKRTLFSETPLYAYVNNLINEQIIVRILTF